ncbi:MAG: OmpA family protein [Polyangiales bacterium]
MNFRTDSDVITGRRSFQVLDSVVSILRAMTNIAQIDIQGHTDDRGSADHNRDLSNRRALSVRTYLVQHGLDESRLVAHGFGPDCPLMPGSSRAARAANRRVQFVIVTPETPAGQCANLSAAAGPDGNAAVSVPTPTPTTRRGRHGGGHGGGRRGRRRH